VYVRTSVAPAAIHRVTLGATGPPSTFTTTSLGGNNPFELEPMGGTLYFTSNDGGGGLELQKLVGNTITRVKDINPGAGGSSPGHLTATSTLLYFSATDGTNGYEIWASNGSAAGTNMVEDSPCAPPAPATWCCSRRT
jgi:ELWxxDGT repeat protein